ncbi:hypothetical protein BJV77DRAFT_1024129 [Russula vinacea]|nr:hypothetical protein BJV77DRAFT_1024129 [Russula vinacea]
MRSFHSIIRKVTARPLSVHGGRKEISFLSAVLNVLYDTFCRGSGTTFLQRRLFLYGVITPRFGCVPYKSRISSYLRTQRSVKAVCQLANRPSSLRPDGRVDQDILGIPCHRCKRFGVDLRPRRLAYDRGYRWTRDEPLGHADTCRSACYRCKRNVIDKTSLRHYENRTPICLFVMDPCRQADSPTHHLQLSSPASFHCTYCTMRHKETSNGNLGLAIACG